MSKPKQRRLTSFFKPVGDKNDDKEQSDDTPGLDQPAQDDDTPIVNKIGPKTKREFRPEWLQQNSWLRFENDKMICNVCSSEGKDNPFTRGCTNFRHSTLTRHIASIQHKASLESSSLRLNMKKQVHDLLCSKNEAAVGALRSVYWLAKEQLPTLKHKSLLNLQKLQGCTFPNELSCASNVNYTSHIAAEDIQDALCEVLCDSMNSKLSESPYISILLDESCDISVTKKLLIYARTISQEFEIETNFITNVRITDGTAKTIYDTVKSVLSERGVNLDKVLVVGSDGASVMTGSKNGFVALVRKNDSPFLLGVHCIAHRLALCSSQAAEKVPYLKSYQQILSDLFYHFKRSALRRQKLKDIQNILDDPLIQYKELHSVRWFSMYAALEAVFRTWASLATYMESAVESKNDSTAKGFFKKITSFVFIATTHLLMDIIPKLTQLSLFFQKENIDLAMLKPSVDSVVQQLVWLKSNNGNFLSEILALGDHISEFKEEDLKSYGVAQISDLTDHYGCESQGHDPIINTEETLHEWELCKSLIVQQRYPCHTVQSTWKLINANHPDSFPNLTKLATIAVLAPLQTATVERGFSVQNEIKVSARNRLSSERLNTLMQLSLGPDIEQFDFTAALMKWKQTKQRKLFAK